MNVCEKAFTQVSNWVNTPEFTQERNSLKVVDVERDLAKAAKLFNTAQFTPGRPYECKKYEKALGTALL